MLPDLFLSRRMAGAVRRGWVLGVLTLAFLAGCSQLGHQQPKLSLAPMPEMAEKEPQQENETEPFALTNEGRRIEDRLLDRQRKILLPD